MESWRGDWWGFDGKYEWSTGRCLTDRECLESCKRSVLVLGLLGVDLDALIDAARGATVGSKNNEPMPKDPAKHGIEVHYEVGGDCR
jgi:hypothetical protein